MEYLRKTVNSAELAPIFDLPPGLRNRRVEVIILPIDSVSGQREKRKSSQGSLKKYANPQLISLEKQAWAEAAEEKHADS